VFDLTGLVTTDMNADFKLDEASARAGSPLFWPAPKGSCQGLVPRPSKCRTMKRGASYGFRVSCTMAAPVAIPLLLPRTNMLIA
jgi:hypothetical protein